MNLHKTQLLACGSTALQEASLVEEALTRACKVFPYGQVALTRIETVAAAPHDALPGRTFAAIGEDLSRFSPRDFRQPPRWLQTIHPAALADGTQGAGKNPAAGRVLCWLNRPRILDAIAAGWPDPKSALLARRQLLTAALDLHLDSQTIWILLVALGGATGHACVTEFVDFALQQPGSPLVCAIATGTRCGISHDDGDTERKNALALLASLSRRHNPSRLWTFLMDGAPDQRDQVLRGAARLALRLMLTREGETPLVRLLRDGFSVSAQRFGASPICVVNFDEIRVDNAHARARSLDLLAEVLFGP